MATFVHDLLGRRCASSRRTLCTRCTTQCICSRTIPNRLLLRLPGFIGAHSSSAFHRHASLRDMDRCNALPVALTDWRSMPGVCGVHASRLPSTLQSLSLLSTLIFPRLSFTALLISCFRDIVCTLMAQSDPPASAQSQSSPQQPPATTHKASSTEHQGATQCVSRLICVLTSRNLQAVRLWPRQGEHSSRRLQRQSRRYVQRLSYCTNINLSTQKDYQLSVFAKIRNYFRAYTHA